MDDAPVTSNNNQPKYSATRPQKAVQGNRNANQTGEQHNVPREAVSDQYGKESSGGSRDANPSTGTFIYSRPPADDSNGSGSPQVYNPQPPEGEDAELQRLVSVKRELEAERQQLDAERAQLEQQLAEQRAEAERERIESERKEAADQLLRDSSALLNETTPQIPPQNAASDPIGRLLDSPARTEAGSPNSLDRLFDNAPLSADSIGTGSQAAEVSKDKHLGSSLNDLFDDSSAKKESGNTKDEITEGVRGSLDFASQVAERMDKDHIEGAKEVSKALSRADWVIGIGDAILEKDAKMKDTKVNNLVNDAIVTGLGKLLGPWAGLFQSTDTGGSVDEVSPPKAVPNAVPPER